MGGWQRPSICALLGLALVFVLSGYVGKYIALKSEPTIKDALTREFWEPTVPFWIGGIVGSLLAIAVMGAIWGLFACAGWVLCCGLCGWLIKKRKKRDGEPSRYEMVEFEDLPREEDEMQVYA